MTFAQIELTEVDEDDVDVSEAVYFTRNRLAIRLRDGETTVVAALHPDAASKLARELMEWL